MQIRVALYCVYDQKVTVLLGKPQEAYGGTFLFFVTLWQHPLSNDVGCAKKVSRSIFVIMKENLAHKLKPEDCQSFGQLVTHMFA